MRGALADQLRVQCINKTNRADPHERITHIGGFIRGGSPWRLREAEAIAAIELGRLAFYVERPAGQAVDVIVAERFGRKYLKTSADGQRPDNLLALPECR